MASRNISISEASRPKLPRHIRLKFDETRQVWVILAPERVLARLDRVAIGSILQNLLDNALRYVPAGGRIEIALSADARHGLQLSVIDDGPGIAPEHRASAFDRFWRGRDHDQPGSGLGLAIVRQAAGRLGGRVTLESGIDGRGARFELRLPASVLGIP